MKFNQIFRNRLLRRASTRWLIIVNIAALIVLVFYVSFQVRPQDFAVPARFSSLSEFVSLSKWYWHAIPAAFLAICLAINLLLANALLKTDESVELQRLAVKVLIFQFVLSLLTITVAFQLIKTAAI